MIVAAANHSSSGTVSPPDTVLFWANGAHRGINEGRQSAREVDLFLEKSTSLPVTGGIVKRTAQEILARGPSREIQGRAERAPLQVAAAAN